MLWKKKNGAGTFGVKKEKTRTLAGVDNHVISKYSTPAEEKKTLCKMLLILLSLKRHPSIHFSLFPPPLFFILFLRFHTLFRLQPSSLLSPLLHRMKSDQDEHRRAANDVGAKAGDEASVEAGRRPRGRPPGSKNKPKPPVVITRVAESAMRPHVLEVPGGLDIATAVANYARRKGVGLCVLAGNGSVSNVTLRQPGPGTTHTVTFHGRFDILSISATFLPTGNSAVSGSSSFAVSLSGPQGQIVGGSVAGPLVAMGAVVVVAAVFSSPTYHRLPFEEEDCGSHPAQASSPPDHTSGTGVQVQSQTMSSDMPVYSCPLPSDVIWTPTPRPRPPPF